MTGSLYRMIDFNYELMYKTVDRLVDHNVTSLRKHQQVVEAVLESALNAAFIQEDSTPIAVTEGMFRKAEQDILGSTTRKVGFDA